MITLPDDISTLYKTSMYNHGIRLTDESNIAIRITHSHDKYTIYYFDENQIYRKIKLEELRERKESLKNLYNMYHDKCWLLDDVYIFIPNKVTRNLVLDRMLYKQLNLGDHASRLVELAETTYLSRKKNHYSDFERMFQKIERPIILLEDKFFKYAKVSIGCATTIKKEDVIKNKKELDKWVLGHLENYSGFQKHHIPITALALTNLIITKDKRLEYTFEIKKELRQLFVQE